MRAGCGESRANPPSRTAPARSSRWTLPLAALLTFLLLLPPGPPGISRAQDGAPWSAILSGPARPGPSLPAAASVARSTLLHPQLEGATGSSGWSNITSLVGLEPPARNDSAAAYDSRDGYALVFGGWNGSSYLNDSWSYAADSWSRLHPPVAPSPRGGASFAYDPLDREMLLFGGRNASSTFGDTWSFAGGLWSELGPAVHPSARSGASLSFDTALGQLVLFGGQDPAGHPLNDSWSFVGGNWSRWTGAAPPARFNSLLADDPADSGALLFGGTNGTANQSFGDTWLLRGSNWSLVRAGGGPPALVAPSGVEEPSGAGVLLFGGRSGDGSSYSSGLWEFANGSWAPLITPVAPPGRAETAFVWDEGDAYLLLYGGIGSSGLLNDTWAFAPSLVAEPTANALETDAGAAVNFAGAASGGVGPYLYAWESSVGAVRGTSPIGAWSVSFASEGTVTVTLLVSDSTGARANATLLIRVDPDPQLRVSAGALSTDVGLPDSLVANVTGGVPPGVVSWAFGDGVSAGGSRIAHAFAAPGTYTVRASLRDAIGRNASGALTIGVAPLPSAQTLVTPEHPSEGTAVDFTARVQGGTGASSLSWSFGDGSSATGANVTHLYSAPGTFEVSLNVTDAAGGSSVGSFLLNVSAAAAPPPAFLDTTAGITSLLLLLAILGALLGVGVRRARARRRAAEGGGETESSG